MSLCAHRSRTEGLAAVTPTSAHFTLIRATSPPRLSVDGVVRGNQITFDTHFEFWLVLGFGPLAGDVCCATTAGTAEPAATHKPKSRRLSRPEFLPLIAALLRPRKRLHDPASILWNPRSPARACITDPPIEMYTISFNPSLRTMFSMAFEPTRRRLTRSAAAALAGLLPRGPIGNTSGSKKAVIHADHEIGVVGPEFHSHFAEPPGFSVNGGIWVGKKSTIPNIDGFQKAIDALKESGVPVLRWPGGCFVDDHHRRGGIGSREKPSMSVSRQGSRVIVTQVNPRRDVDMDLDCSLSGVTAKEERAQVLHEFDINAHNSFEQPDRLVTNPHSVAVEGSRFRIMLPSVLSDGSSAVCLEVKPS